MNRLIILICAFFLFGADRVGADVIDAPHTKSQGVLCGDCHNYSLWWEFSPSDQNTDRDSLIVEPLCGSCHNGNGSYPYAITHSRSMVGSMHREDLGDDTWSRTCLDCHDPHLQTQLRGWLGDPSVSVDDLYVVQGVMTSPVNLGDETSRFNYTISSAKVAWDNPADWANKLGQGRGLILTVTSGEAENTYEVLSATGGQPADSGLITVKGNIDLSLDGANFGLFYGQLIKKEISVDPDADGNFTLADVKFFDGRGGFVNNELTGICQVCHGLTNHFRYNTTIDSHIDILGAANAATLQCTTCHAHDVAFGHGTDGGSDCVGCHNNQKDNGDSTFTYSKHVEHLSLEIYCSRCHSTVNRRELADGELFADTAVCSKCHHDATDLTPADGNDPPLTTDFKNGWLSLSYDFTCEGCHNFPPDYQNGPPNKANSHLTHTNDGKTCDNCHATTMADATNLLASETGTHTNNIYDVIPGDGFTFNYAYADPAGTCAGIGTNSSCHLGNDAEWGDQLDCVDCHQGADDVEGILDDNLVAKISFPQWTSTGHGREVASGNYSSGNVAANLTCEYCHSRSIAHGESSNPFRLTEFTISTPNNVCLVCHLTDSTGYSPAGTNLPVVAASSDTWIDSYHGHGEGLGGRFCWDCHDPHGDSNIYMVHDRVAMRSDKDTGAPTMLSSESAEMLIDFKANATGANYAKVTAPFNGICNVCHLNTDKYTSSSGEDHNQATPCTVCHKHNGTRPDNAFTAGDCLDCHNVEVTGANTTRREIDSEFPATTETAGSAHAHFGGELDSDDCRVCHNQIYHTDGKIRLWGGDKEVRIDIYGQLSNESIVYIGDNATNIRNIDAQKYEDISDFCMSCHDSDGMNSSPYPFDPFGNGNAPPDAATKFKGNRFQKVDYVDDVLEIKYGRGKIGFSHHPIRHRDQDGLGIRIECTSCHGVHSASASTKLADPDDTSKTWGTVAEETVNRFCLKCHDGGTNPHHPGFPEGVAGQVYNRATTPGAPCELDPGVDEVYDCRDNCVPAYTTTDWPGDGWCDDGTYGVDLLCGAYGFDGGDCGVTYTENDYDGYSMLKGLETCEGYSQPSWDHDNYNSKVSWSKSAHGGGTKRRWVGYEQNPQVPTYEVDCIDCHEYHGSYNPPSNSLGNPYMLRDYVDGSKYVDDGNIKLVDNPYALGCDDNSTLIEALPECTPQYNCDNSTGTPLICEQFGGSGPVIIDKPNYVTKNGNDQATYNGWVYFCSKCHVNWETATSSGAHNINSGYSSCLTCHAHGTVMYGGMDMNNYPSYDADPDDTFEILCP